MAIYDIGLIGLGVMGQSLARNLASRKLSTLVFNRTTKKASDFIKDYGQEYLGYEKTLSSFIKNLKTPRKIILMVNAGKPVDDVMKNLLPHLQKGDVVVDGGNSNYHDTIRRESELKKKNIHFVGLGVSGGEEGALRGPSLMPGGSKESWKLLKPILSKIAAKDFGGKPSVTYIGEDGAGHYVKMVHNGIEYAVMQMMAEAYDMMRKMYGMTPDQIADIFNLWNSGKLKSYLFEIAVPVLREKDNFEKGNLVDFILDKAGQKGTGRWTAMDALQKGAVLSSVTEAVYARGLSAFKEERKKLSRQYKMKTKKAKYPQKKFIKEAGEALYAGIISAYAQGFQLINLAAKEHDWIIDMAEVARIWEGGCIIRAD